MHVVVTGGSGFIGQHLVQELLTRGHRVTVIAREAKRCSEMPWAEQVNFIAADLTEGDTGYVSQCGIVDVLAHLAWPGLPNYRDLFHLERNLPTSYQCIRAFVEAGCSQVLVTGTCFEYGLQEGCLKEDLPTKPSNPYGVAKDSLRRFLEMLQTKCDFRLQWARLFYMYGMGQNPKSLLALLDSAIERGESVFNMSLGEQLRDYLPVSRVASHLAMLCESAEFAGLVNICQGAPISVRRLVEQHLGSRGAKIDLNFGFYPYPDYEPLAFWGDNSRLRSVEMLAEQDADAGH